MWAIPAGLMDRSPPYYLLMKFRDQNSRSEPMRRTMISGVVMLSLFLTACGPGEVHVMAEAEVMDPETGAIEVLPIEDLEVQLLPFDRDVIFDSLEAAAARPEPELPADLEIRRDSMLTAQAEWREAESRWLALRERLQEISRELEQYTPAENRYRELFNEFGDAEAEYEQAEAMVDETFETFDRLQQSTFAELEEFRAVLMSWEEEAFAGYGEAMAARLSAAGREILADTTDATGQADFAPRPGEWWVHGRHPLINEELYWNEPIVVERGTPVELTLNRANAEIREIY